MVKINTQRRGFAQLRVRLRRQFQSTVERQKRFLRERRGAGEVVIQTRGKSQTPIRKNRSLSRIITRLGAIGLMITVSAATPSKQDPHPKTIKAKIERAFKEVRSNASKKFGLPLGHSALSVHTNRQAGEYVRDDFEEILEIRPIGVIALESAGASIDTVKQYTILFDMAREGFQNLPHERRTEAAASAVAKTIFSENDFYFPILVTSLMHNIPVRLAEEYSPPQKEAYDARDRRLLGIMVRIQEDFHQANLMNAARKMVRFLTLTKEGTVERNKLINLRMRELYNEHKKNGEVFLVEGEAHLPPILFTSSRPTASFPSIGRYFLSGNIREAAVRMTIATYLIPGTSKYIESKQGDRPLLVNFGTGKSPIEIARKNIGRLTVEQFESIAKKIENAPVSRQFEIVIEELNKL
jgi:hypothetical protein